MALVSLKSISNEDRIDISHTEAASNIGGSARSPEIAFDIICRLLRDNASMQAMLEIVQIPAVKNFKSKSSFENIRNITDEENRLLAYL